MRPFLEKEKRMGRGRIGRSIRWAPEQMLPSSPRWPGQLWIACTQAIGWGSRQPVALEWSQRIASTPLWEKHQAPLPGTCRVCLCPAASTVWRRGFAFDQGPCPPAPFWPHPKTGYGHMGSRHQRGHMGSRHQAKSEDQLFAKLLILASKPAAGGWKGGLPANLVGQQREVPTLHCGAREGLLTMSKPMGCHKLHCDPQKTHTHPDLWRLSVCPFTNPFSRCV